jgi:tetratricopeptide (TPR) repeat protein
MFRRSPHQCVSKWLLPRVLSLTLTIFCALSSQGQTNDPSVAGPTLLELARPIIRPLAGGQIEQFHIELAPNQYAKLNVEQRGIDVVVRVLDPDAKLLTEFDADPRLTGTETAEIAVERGGAYTVRVEPRQKSAAAGSFEIVMTDLRGAVSSDLLLDEARRLLTAANALWRSGKYDEALPLAVKARDIRQKEMGVESADYAQALFVVANITGDMGDFTTAAETYKKAIAIREKVVGKDHISMTPLLNNYAVLLKDHGDYPQAEELLQRVLQIRTRELPPNHLLTASVLNNIASISRIKGDDAKAAEL